MGVYKKIFFVSTAFFFAGITLFAQKQITVAADGSGNFRSIQEAINSLPADAKEQRIILIKNGTYNEKLFIDKDFITLKGEHPRTEEHTSERHTPCNVVCRLLLTKKNDAA